MIPPRHPPRPLLPVPNGYDDFLKAAASVNAVARLSPHTARGLSNSLKLNKSALESARLGCRKDCAVSIEYTRSYWIKNKTGQSGFVGIAQAFLAEGGAAEKEGRISDAARSYLDAMDFGDACARGGLVIDRSTGLMCEMMVFGSLSNILQKVDGATCREAVQRLRALESKREGWDVIWKREKSYLGTVMSLRDRGVRSLQKLAVPRMLRDRTDTTKEQYEQVRTWQARLTVQLTGRASELEKAKPVDGAPALVPADPKAVLNGSAAGAGAELRVNERQHQ